MNKCPKCGKKAINKLGKPTTMPYEGFEIRWQRGQCIPCGQVYVKKSKVKLKTA